MKSSAVSGTWQESTRKNEIGALTTTGHVARELEGRKKLWQVSHFGVFHTLLYVEGKFRALAVREFSVNWPAFVPTRDLSKCL
jgi:hypothetical protein